MTTSVNRYPDGLCEILLQKSLSQNDLASPRNGIPSFFMTTLDHGHDRPYNELTSRFQKDSTFCTK